MLHFRVICQLMEIYFATNNEHKRDELQKIFTSHKIVIPKDVGIEFNPTENGSTFYENSLIKAKALYDIVHSPTLADDSGLCVDILNGKPGIFSSRYAGYNFPKGKDGEELSSSEKNKLLLEHIEKVEQEKKLLYTHAQNNSSNLSQNTLEQNTSMQNTRSARFVCALVLYLENEKIYFVQETLEGEIVSSIEKACGSGGFGYDPIFFLPQFGQTVAELSSSQKNEISHRGKACKAMNKWLDILF